MSFGTIGRKGREFLARRGAKIAKDFPRLYDGLDLDKAKIVASWVVPRFQRGEIDALYIVYNEFKSAITQKVVLEPLLPLRETPPDQKEGAIAQILFEPNQEALLERLVDRASQVGGRLGGLGRIDVVDLLRWPGVVKEAERDTAPLAAAAMDLLAEALATFTESRSAEGARIAEMLRSRSAQVRTLTDEIATRLPEAQARIRAKFSERLAALGAEVNPDRFEQEVALLLQKMDVAEELDRLRSHLAELDSTLTAGEAVGRKLDFLMQEFNREANTLSSKSQDVETTRRAVELKVLIEQMREQVQNVE